MRSQDPFVPTIRRLLEIEGISGRELARRTARHGYKRVETHVAKILRGVTTVSAEQMEAFSRALQIDPETFAEYRLQKMRDRYDPRVIGWDQAIRNLEEVEEPARSVTRHRPSRLRRRDDRGGQAGSA